MAGAAEDARFVVEGETVRGTFHPSVVPGKRAIVLNHGLLSCRKEYMDAPERLAERGYHVLAFDQRGFGESEGNRGVHARARAVADLRGALDFVRARVADARVGVVGHSFGAAMSVAALADGVGFHAATLVAPVDTIRGELGDGEYRMYQVGHALHRAKQAIGLGPLRVPYKNRYRDLFMDPEAVKRAESTAFLMETVSLENYEELLAVNASTWARDVRTPTLIVLCEHDRAVKHENSMRVHDVLAGEKALVTLDSGHSAFGDRAQKELLDHMDRWFQKFL